MTDGAAVLGSPAILGFNDWTAFVAWSGGQWNAAADYPLASVASPESALVARSLDLSAAALSFTGTLDQPRLIGLAAIKLRNATIDCRVRLDLVDDLGAPLADTGWIDYYPAVYDSLDLRWEHPNFWSGQFAPDEIAGVVFTRPVIFDDLHFAAAFRWRLDDGDNPDSYLDVCYAPVAEGWRFSAMPAYGAAQYGRRLRSVVTESEETAHRSIRRVASTMVWKGTLIATREEAVTRGLESLRRNDISEPMIWVPHPDEPRYWPMTCCIVTQGDAGLFGYVTAGIDGDGADTLIDSIPIVLEEVN